METGRDWYRFVEDAVDVAVDEPSKENGRWYWSGVRRRANWHKENMSMHMYAIEVEDKVDRIGVRTTTWWGGVYLSRFCQ